MTSESDLLAEIRLRCGNGDTRLFRNNVAKAWVGEVVHQDRRDITLRNFRMLHAGLCLGSSDLIGWTCRNGAALFTAIEVKYGRTRTTPEQVRFLDAVRKAGGIAGDVRSVEQAVNLLEGKS